MTRWLIAALIDWTVIVASMAAIWRWPLCAPLAIFVIGTRQHALGVLGHDAAHGSISRTWLNDALGQVLCWWPIGVGLDSYRWFHLSHHRSISRRWREDDPELWHMAKFPAVYDVPLTTGHKLRWFALDLIGGGVPEFLTLLRMLLGHTSERDILGPLYLWALAIGAVIWLRLWWVPLVWIIAMSTSNWAVARLRTWREHIGTAGTWDTPVPWWGFLIHLPHNIGEHVEHHKFSWRPFHQLGRYSDAKEAA